MKLRTPFQLSYGVSETRRVYWLRLTEETGWGEAAIPPYYGIDDESMIAFWEDRSRSGGPLPGKVDDISRWVGSVGPAPARCALDMAIHDYLARRRGLALYRLLGLPRPSGIVTAYTIPIASPEEMASTAQKAENFPILKLKLDRDDNVPRVAAIRKTRPDARLMIDANAAWSAEEAVRQLRLLEPFGLELVEQPVPKNDFDGLAYVQRNIDIPVVADESLRDMSDLDRLAEMGVRAVNLKLMKLGGIAPCLEMLRRAANLGLKIMLGCMIETSLGVTAMTHLAGSADWVDLDSPLLIANDPFQGVRYTGAAIDLPSGPGIGVIERHTHSNPQP